MTQPPAGARPMGVTILAVLAAIVGVLSLLGALALLGGGALIAGAGGGMFAGAFGLFGIITLVLAVLYFAFAYGAWTLKPWAWTLGIVSQVVSIVLSILSILGGQSVTSQLIGLVISLVILYYLDTPDVRRAFGRPANSWFAGITKRS
jgi:hypothetical protein